MNVLVTCGPTWAPIDEVRVISNVSSGRLGHLIARELRQRGASVTLIQGPVTDRASLTGIRVLPYRYFHELAALLRTECARGYAVIVHAAAVSDYMVSNARRGKIASSTLPVLRLVKAPKLIEKIKGWAPKSRLAGFKLAPDFPEKNYAGLTQKLFTDARCDWVLVNNGKPDYRACILNPELNVLARATRKETIAAALARIIA